MEEVTRSGRRDGEAVDEVATEAVEDAADSLADIMDTAQEVLSNLEGSKAVNSLRWIKSSKSKARWRRSY